MSVEIAESTNGDPLSVLPEASSTERLHTIVKAMKEIGTQIGISMDVVDLMTGDPILSELPQALRTKGKERVMVTDEQEGPRGTKRRRANQMGDILDLEDMPPVELTFYTRAKIGPIQGEMYCALNSVLVDNRSAASTMSEWMADYCSFPKHDAMSLTAERRLELGHTTDIKYYCRVDVDVEGIRRSMIVWLAPGHKTHYLLLSRGWMSSVYCLGSSREKVYFIKDNIESMYTQVKVTQGLTSDALPPIRCNAEIQPSPSSPEDRAHEREVNASMDGDLFYELGDQVDEKPTAPESRFFTSASIGPIRGRYYALDSVLVDGGSTLNAMPEWVADSCGLFKHNGRCITEEGYQGLGLGQGHRTDIKYYCYLDVYVGGLRRSIVAWLIPEDKQSYSLLLSRAWMWSVWCIGNYRMDAYLIRDDADAEYKELKTTQGVSGSTSPQIRLLGGGPKRHPANQLKMNAITADDSLHKSDEQLDPKRYQLEIDTIRREHSPFEPMPLFYIGAHIGPTKYRRPIFSDLVLLVDELMTNLMPEWVANEWGIPKFDDLPAKTEVIPGDKTVLKQYCLVEVVVEGIRRLIMVWLTPYTKAMYVRTRYTLVLSSSWMSSVYSEGSYRKNKYYITDTADSEYTRLETTPGLWKASLKQILGNTEVEPSPEPSSSPGPSSPKNRLPRNGSNRPEVTKARCQIQGAGEVLRDMGLLATDEPPSDDDTL